MSISEHSPLQERVALDEAEGAAGLHGTSTFHFWLGTNEPHRSHPLPFTQRNNKLVVAFLTVLLCITFPNLLPCGASSSTAPTKEGDGSASLVLLDLSMCRQPCRIADSFTYLLLRSRLNLVTSICRPLLRGSSETCFGDLHLCGTEGDVYVLLM